MKRTLNSCVTFALLLLGTLSIAELIRETVSCIVSPTYPLWVVVICLFLWVTSRMEKGLWIGIPLTGAAVFLLIRYRLEELRLQATAFITDLAGLFAGHFSGREDLYGYTPSVQDYTLLFLLLAALFAAWFLVGLTAKGARLQLILIGSLPFFVICVVLNEKPPAPVVAGLLLFWLLTAAGGSDYSERSGSYAAVLGTAIPLVLLLSGLILKVDPENYSYREPRFDVIGAFETLAQKTVDVAEDLLPRQPLPLPDSFLPMGSSLPQATQPGAGEKGRHSEAVLPAEPGERTAMPSGVLWRNEEDKLDLTLKPEESQQDITFLTIIAEAGGRVYLRNMSFGDYSGSGWLPAEEYGRGSSLGFTAQSAKKAGGSEQKYRIRLDCDSGNLFLPYFSEADSGSDVSVEAGGVHRYEAACFSLPQGYNAAGVGLEPELQYRTFAHNAYTRLPEDTASAIHSLCEREQLTPGREDLIEVVAQFVQSRGIYDPDAPHTPDEDVAVAFLSEGGRGSCLHFATAACVLYRSLGIPARITVGFLAEALPGQETAVKGSDAHAWVEIYEDGTGWIPVEVTGRSGNAPEAGYASQEEAAAVTPTPEIAPVEAPASSFAVGSTSGEGTSTAPVLPIGPVTEAGNTPSESAGRGLTGLLKLLPLLAIPGLIFAVVIRKMFLDAIMRRRIMSPDAKRAAVAVYHLAAKLLRYGGSMPKEITVCAEKAVFSSHGVTEAEVARSRAALDRMIRETMGKMYPIRRFLFKIFF